MSGNTDAGGTTVEPVERKRIALTNNGKKIPLTDAMIELRNGLANGLGYRLVPCTIGRVHPRKDGKPSRQCWERGTHVMDGVEIGNEHIVPMDRGEGIMNLPGHDIYHWPEDVMKAAKTIDREGRPPRKPKPWEVPRE